jgi:hypothetical protein
LWLLILAAAVSALAIAGLVTGIALLSGFAPIALTLVAWFLCFKLFSRDRAPWEHTRVAIVLLIALFAYAILGISLHTDGAALAIVSLYLGYVAWRATGTYADSATRIEDSDDDDDRSHRVAGKRELRADELKQDNPLATFAALLLAVFLMLIVVSPLMHHFFPWYWRVVTTLFLGWF